MSQKPRKEMQPKDHAVIGASYDAPDKVPVVLVGLSEAAWDYMRGGLCHDFDLTKIGINAKLVIFRAKTRKEAMDILSSGPGGTPKIAGVIGIDDEEKPH